MTRTESPAGPTLSAYLVHDDGFTLELIEDAGRGDYADRLKTS